MKAKSTSSKPQKAGFTWVADRRAKNAGYWRKLKAGAKAGGLASKLIAGAVVAGAAAGAAQAMRKKPGGAPKVPEPPSNLSEAPSVESEASKLQRIKKRNTAIVVGTIAAANAASMASDIAAERKRNKQYQAYQQAWREAEQSASGRSQENTSGNTASWHETLRVDPDASPSDVKKAYREAAKKYHPDVNKSPEAEQMMKDLNNAYEKAKRRRKDSLHWDAINEAYRQAWKAYPSVDVRYWVTNL